MTARIVFMGSPDFALPTLEALDNSFDVVGVVTQPDRPAGRGRLIQPPEVKVLAQKLGVEIIQPKSLKDPQALNQLKNWRPDVIVVAAFGQILREDVLTLPPFGCLNVHASLLPRWRGAAPVQAAILHDVITGVTIMKMDQGLDTGPILSQSKVRIKDDTIAGELFDHLAQLGAELLVETLPSYLSGELQAIPQDQKAATYAPKLQKSDGRLDFNQSAAFLERMVRAYNPWPSSFQFHGDTRIKIFAAHVKEAKNILPGLCYVVDEQPAWGTADGLLVLDWLQAAGKNRVSGKDFLMGVKDWTLDQEEN